MFTNIRLKIRNFFKKNKKVIIIIAIIWAIVIVINYTIDNVPQIDVPITTYKPHTALMDDSVVPERLQSPIEELIKGFVNECNAKDYEKAYNMLSEECIKQVFPDLEEFKTYVDEIFDQKKICNIQDFSNKDGYYIYTVTILNDIMASGMTGATDNETYEETFVMKEENGSLKLAIRGYIGNTLLDKMYEDEYLKVTIENVEINYDTMTYDVKIRNKTDNIIVLDNSTQKYEIVLNTDEGYRNLYGFYIDPVVVTERDTKTFKLTFTRFFDENGDVKSLIFNYVRVLKSYTGTAETRQEEINNAVKLYSFVMDL